MVGPAHDALLVPSAFRILLPLLRFPTLGDRAPQRRLAIGFYALPGPPIPCGDRRHLLVLENDAKACFRSSCQRIADDRPCSHRHGLRTQKLGSTPPMRLLEYSYFFISNVDAC